MNQQSIWRQPRSAGIRQRGRTALTAVLAAGVGLTMAATASTAAVGADGPSTAFDLTMSKDSHNPRLAADAQGFSVESADFAHGYLTSQLMSQRLKTLGRTGVIRLGGYSMDLVWPAFGAYRNAPPPPEAIGGVVDQGDMDALKKLLKDSGWQATLGIPLKKLLAPEQIKNPAKDPSPAVTLDQVVAEVKAAHDTLGDDLLAVELGNEFDNVTTLSGAEYYAKLKNIAAAIHAGVPAARLKMTGPSANTAATNTKLDEFVTAMEADSSVEPEKLMTELTSHFYPGSHCGSSNLKLSTLMSAGTWQSTQAKLDGILATGAKLSHPLPSVINESNSASCSGQPGVSNSFGTSLWSLDYLLQASKTGIARVAFHTNTRAICGDFQQRTSPNYPISYRYYGAFCAHDQAQLDAEQLSATPLYYGLWAFRQIPAGGRFVDLDLPESALPQLRAYGVEGPQGTQTVVLINVQDPASATSTSDQVSLTLPSSFQHARQVVLRSGDSAGLASTDASAITLGGRQVRPDGVATGRPSATPVPVDHRTASVSVAPGTATIVTFSHHEGADGGDD